MGRSYSTQFERDGACFAARNSGLYRSDDGGRSWRSAYDALALAEPLATTAVACSPAYERDHLVIAGASGGLLRSIDGGSTWHTAGDPPQQTGTDIYLTDDGQFVIDHQQVAVRRGGTDSADGG